MKLVRLTELTSQALSRTLAKISSVKDVFADAVDVSMQPPAVPPFEVVLQPG